MLVQNAANKIQFLPQSKPTKQPLPDSSEEIAKPKFDTIEDLVESYNIAVNKLKVDELTGEDYTRGNLLNCNLECLNFNEINNTNFDQIQKLIKEFWNLSDKSHEAFIASLGR